MCDLWRMSLCPHSLLRRWASQELSYSALDWKAVRSRRQQRVGLPGDRTQGKSKKGRKVRQIYSKVPKTSWAPSSEGLFPISYNAFFTDIGALLSCIKFHHNLHLLITFSGAARGGGTGGTCPPHRMSVGPIGPAFKRFFSAKFYKKATFYHICKMKWPKSGEKIEIGGLFSSWGALRQKFCVFSCKILRKKTFFPYFQNEVAEIRGENKNWEGAPRS